jgi:hypothetical protein
MTYEEYQRRVIDAQAQWNDDRTAIHNSTRILTSQFQGETDPPAISALESYVGMPLSEMNAKVDQMRPAEVLQASQAWHNLSLKLSGAVQSFNAEFGFAVDGRWKGQSADAAVNAVKHYAEQSRPLPVATMLVANKLSEMYTGLHQTQTLMPRENPPTQADGGKTLPVVRFPLGSGHRVDRIPDPVERMSLCLLASVGRSRPSTRSRLPIV